MTQVIPMQLQKIENLQQLSMFVDAIQNPIKYMQMIEEASKVLNKLKEVIETTATINNAQTYLELAKKERTIAENSLSQMEEEFELSTQEKTISLQFRDNQIVRPFLRAIRTMRHEIPVGIVSGVVTIPIYTIKLAKYIMAQFLDDNDRAEIIASQDVFTAEINPIARRLTKTCSMRQGLIVLKVFENNTVMEDAAAFSVKPFSILIIINHGNVRSEMSVCVCN